MPLADGTDLGLMLSFRNPARWRRPFTEVYAGELALAQRAEALGFDTIWLTEHHFADDGYSPSTVTIAGALAAMTERVRIGFNLLLLPLHNPIRLAEDLAALDVLSGGRIDVGVGQGYAVHEYAGFGIPRSERLGRFLEGLEVMQGLWSNDEFSHEGAHYRVERARLMPKPVQQPGPPIWIGATSNKAIARAGRCGANLLGLANRGLQATYEQARADAGLDLDTANVLQLHWAHVGPDDDAAWHEAGPHFHHLLTVYAEWANAAADADLGGGKIVVPDVGELRNLQRRVIFRPVIGGADTVARALDDARRAVRTTHLTLGALPGMNPSVTAGSLARFVADVVPRLDQPTS